MNITPIQLAKRVEKWQERLGYLGVGGFEIRSVSVVQEVEGHFNAMAAVLTSADYDNVRFQFNVEYLAKCTERDLDETIIHEWLHVAMRDFDHSLRAVESWMPAATYEMFADTVDHEREGLINRLATVICDFWYASLS